MVCLGSVNDGGFDIAHTIANMLVMCGHAEPRHRIRLQQILTLPRMHQGESTSRFRKKVHYRRKFLWLFIQQRKERFARAWEMSDNNEVRNRWVRAARKALDEHRKQNPQAETIRVSLCIYKTNIKHINLSQIYKCNWGVIIFIYSLMSCTRVKMTFVLLLSVYILTGQLEVWVTIPKVVR